MISSSVQRLPDPKYHHYIIVTQKRREIGHYGEEGEEVTDEEARESFQWAWEFMETVKAYLEQTLKVFPAR